MKYLFMLIFLVSTLNLFAQDVNPTQKGNLMLGGGGHLDYGSEFDETSSGTFSLGLNPSIGWFLSDGFALGFGPTFNVASNLYESGDTFLGGGMNIFMVKYFGSGIFIRGSAGYSLSHIFVSSDYVYDYTDHLIKIIPEVGYAFFLGPNVALELSLKDTFKIELDDSTSYHNTTGVYVGFQIFL